MIRNISTFFFFFLRKLAGLLAVWCGIYLTWDLCSWVSHSVPFIVTEGEVVLMGQIWSDLFYVAASGGDEWYSRNIWQTDWISFSCRSSKVGAKAVLEKCRRVGALIQTFWNISMNIFKIQICILTSNGIVSKSSVLRVLCGTS